MQARLFELPYLTAELPGTGGTVRAEPEDFRVDELPAYGPEGAGDHVFVHIEKRGLTTPVAAERLAEAVGVRVAEVGWAGMKDRHAVTRQWLSLPPPCTPEAVQALALDDITVLAAARHRHKLRTGHLRGNRFTLRVRDLDCDADTAAARAQAILDRLAEAPGSPNWFGPQRFGRDGKNAALGRDLVTGTGRAPRGRQKRLFVSALQSALFNEHLRRRLDDGLYARVIEGDILQKRASGGLFATTEPELDQGRLAAGEIVPTGPMFGHKLRSPAPDTAAAAREAEVLASEGLDLADFARVGKLGVGTRRALAVALGEPAVRVVDADRIELAFSLPAGSYATAVVREVVKGPNPFPG